MIIIVFWVNSDLEKDLLKSYVQRGHERLAFYDGISVVVKYHTVLGRQADYRVLINYEESLREVFSKVLLLTR